MKNECILLLLLVLVGCRKDPCDENERCQTVEPSEGTVRVMITPPAEGDTVGVSVLEGHVEEGREVAFLNMTTAQAALSLPVEKKYSATAAYTEGKDTLVALDGGRLVLEDYLNCDEVCYSLEDLELDLRRAD